MSLQYQNRPFSVNVSSKSAKCLQHLLTLEGLKTHILNDILMQAQAFHKQHQINPALNQQQISLYQKILGYIPQSMSVFFENSTRTRTTFEMAAQRLGLPMQHLNIQTSSTQKGESLTDTMENLLAMGADIFVIRHGDSGASHTLARFFKQRSAEIQNTHPSLATRMQNCHLINAGDGQHAHPTQSLLDIYTIKQTFPNIQDLRVLIVGDVLHSRVARSNIFALSALGCPEIRVLAPYNLLPASIEGWGVHLQKNFEQAIEGVDVVMMLRLQKERMQSGLIANLEDYHQNYGLNAERFSKAKPHAIVMHPGPINRGVEISSDIADGVASKIMHEVENGVFIRMAVFDYLIKNRLP
jgi:aspartate carbamoyltransferase catalytic subunit